MKTAYHNQYYCNGPKAHLQIINKQQTVIVIQKSGQAIKHLENLSVIIMKNLII